MLYNSADWCTADSPGACIVAASYVPPTTGDASVRLFNLSPSTKLAGLRSSLHGGAAISGVKYSLGSDWGSFALGNQTWSFLDDDVSPPSVLLQTNAAPAGPPIGSTQFLLGLRAVNMRALMLNDAPEVQCTSAVVASAFFFALVSARLLLLWCADFLSCACMPS